MDHLRLKSYIELCEAVRNIDPVLYAKTRNNLDGHVTRLSPYISRGVLALPTIRDLVFEKYSLVDSYKFIQELAWREYFQRVWEAKGEAIFEDLRFAQDSVERQDMPQSIVQGSSGIEIIDYEIDQLYTTGYIHNHSRLSIASLCCNLGRCDWYEPSRWMYYHLLDGDPASNMLSWQWVAGTSISKKYFVDQNLINHWSGSLQERTFLSFDRERTMDVNVPKELRQSIQVDLPVHLPSSEAVDFSDGRDICLYYSFSLDPQWRKNQDVHRVLLIEPRWFESMPVSKRVMSFIVAVARHMLPDIKIVVQNFDDFAVGLSDGQKMYVRSHPSIFLWKNASLTQDAQEWLFPEVQGYYKSFFTYWKQCEKFLH